MLPLFFGKDYKMRKVALYTACALAAGLLLSACTQAQNSASDSNLIPVSSNVQTASSNTLEIASVFDTGKTVSLTVNSSYVVEDISSISADDVINYDIPLADPDGGGGINPKYLDFNATEATPTSMVIVEQTITNTSGQDLELNVGSMKIIPKVPMDAANGDLIYVNPHENSNDSSEFFHVLLKSGQSLDLSFGFAVVTESLASGLYYQPNIFGYSDEKDIETIPMMELSL